MFKARVKPGLPAGRFFSARFMTMSSAAKKD